MGGGGLYLKKISIKNDLCENSVEDRAHDSTHQEKKIKKILTILVSTLSLVGVALLILYEHCVATHFFESTDMLFAKCLNKRLRFLRKN